ncbi:hypothetical protein EIP86_009961 [Pleurotus ostreatoroseus]|nr:hypothetical protein EIP86_009961 [Pleurotus ostreatoroseus]
MSYERNLLPLDKATIRFSVTISTDDPQEALRQTVLDTNSKIQLLASPKPATLLDGAVEGGTSALDSVQSVVDDWSPLLEKLQIFCNIMDGVAEVHPYATMAWSILSAAYKVFKQQLDRDAKMKSLYESMNGLYMLVYELQKNIEDDPIEIRKDVIIRIARQTTDCCYFIRDYASDPGFVKRMVKNTFSSVDQRIQSYCSTFEALREAFFAKLHVETRIVITRVLSEVQDISMKVDLNDLPYAGGAALWVRDMNGPEHTNSPTEYLAGKMCLPGTRVDTLQEIQDWVNYDGKDAERILLLTGAAGTGKSAIAHTIAYRFAALDRLAASFAFNRNQKERTPDKLFPTMARDMADFDPDIGRALFSAIEQNKALRTTAQLDFQFTNFIVKPTKDLILIGPIVIVIDALDECSDATDASRRELLSLLARRVSELPSNFRILITARPEHDIISQLCDDHTYRMSMHNINPTSNTDDICLYVRCRLLESPPIPLEDIDETCCIRLASSSQGLFQWAFVACEQIVSAELSGPGVTARERYGELIESTQGKSQRNILDSLYTNVLSQLFEGKDTSLSRFKSVMTLVLASFEPPSLDTLNEMLRHNGDTFNAKTIVSYLGALLSGVTSSDEPIRPLHTSFRDYLTDKERSSIFHVEGNIGHCHLALATLRTMQTGLKFNICGLESSYQLNEDVAGIQDVGQFIPAHLSYASRFWSNHLKSSGPDRLDDTYLASLRVFLQERLLFWFEILSLLDSVSIASPALALVSQQIPNSMLQPGITISEFAGDARKFVETFSTPISQSAPHVYISALPFAPESSFVKQLYASQFFHTLKVCDPYKAWPAAQNVLNVQANVRSVAVSPDGLYVASVGYSGSMDRINIWDMNTGKPVSRAFPEQTEGWVAAVAFSKDGRYLCTCSDDETVQIWNWETSEVVDHRFPEEMIHTIAFNPVQTSQVVCGSLSGAIIMWDIADDGIRVLWSHNNVPAWTYGSRVLSVAWSPDGALIASGGENGIARLWDARTGKPVGSPLEGHSDVITCVTFSPNGKYLASSSYDKSVRLWNIDTFAPLGSPLVQSMRPQAVESVAFSPDGSSLASCADTVVFLWDLSKLEIPQPMMFHGHTEYTYSVTYSPDGMHVVSGSDDGTIRMWDAETRIATKTLEKHLGAVLSIDFSRDGRYIVSGSQDKTVRIWDSITGTQSALSTENRGHITCVAISPDGRVVATSSWDNVIQLHDIQTRQPLFPPLKGHDAGVRNVAFLDKYFISSCSDKIILWDPLTGEPAQHQLIPPDCDDIYFETLVVSRDSHFVVAGWAQEFYVWNIGTGQLIHQLAHGGDGCLQLAMSPDGKDLWAWTTGSVRLWDVETGESQTIDLSQFSQWTGAIAVSPSGAHFAFSDLYGTLWIWDSRAQTMSISVDCNIGIITALAFSSDGRRLASGSEDGKVQVWDIVQDDGESASHALPEVNLICPDTVLKPVEDIKLRNDGWVVVARVDEDQLLFWVPVEQRDMLILPVRKTVLGGEPNELDLSRFVHGTKWSQCHSLQ